MRLLFGLWLLATALEYGIYRFRLTRQLQRSLAIVSLTMLVASATALLVSRWPLWLGLWVLSLYRVINLSRLYVGRNPDDLLRNRSQNTANWLIGAQVIATTGAALFIFSDSGDVALVMLLIVQLAIATLLARSTWFMHRYTSYQAPADVPPRISLPSLSVLVPARDETDDLEHCLTSLLASDYPKLEIIVLDDNSTNPKTPAIIRAFAHDGVRFVAGDKPDLQHWLPKNQAYDKLVSEASGSIVLFCGVDIQFAPDSLRLLVENFMANNRQMVSVLPEHTRLAQAHLSVLQPMRYFWELCLPRRLFKRPPVLSSCWLATTEFLQAHGGFHAYAKSIIPEAHLAKRAVVADAYRFIRSGSSLGVQTEKAPQEQYATTVRTRYPQLHRRLEMVALTSLSELIFLIGPLALLLTIELTPLPRTCLFVWSVASLLLGYCYYQAAVPTRQNSRWLFWALYPVAIIIDIVMLHISMLRYEFGTVTWKGRSIEQPVMQPNSLINK